MECTTTQADLHHRYYKMTSCYSVHIQIIVALKAPIKTAANDILKYFYIFKRK